MVVFVCLDRGSYDVKGLGHKTPCVRTLPGQAELAELGQAALGQARLGPGWGAPPRQAASHANMTIATSPR